MNENYNNLNTLSNIIQAINNVLMKLNPENITVPTDVNEVAMDIQAAVNRNMGK